MLKQQAPPPEVLNMNYTEQDVPRVSAKQYHSRPMAYKHIVSAECSCGLDPNTHEREVWCRRTSRMVQVPDWDEWSRTAGTVPDYTKEIP